MKSGNFRLVLFIDGPLAGQMKQLDASQHYWNTIKVDPAYARVGFAHLDEAERIVMDRITYQPIGGDSHHLNPEPWTCKERATDNESWYKHLAYAWMHLHDMRGFTPGTSEFQPAVPPSTADCPPESEKRP